MGSTQSTTLGWALFLRYGMWAWCQRCRELTPTPSPSHAVPGGLCPATTRADVVQVLAAMVLALQPEVAHGE